MGLTQKQSAVLSFIRGYAKQHHISPSFDEIRAALSIKSKAQISAFVGQLEQRGYLRRTPGRARAMELVSDRFVECPNCRHEFEVLVPDDL